MQRKGHRFGIMQMDICCSALPSCFFHFDFQIKCRSRPFLRGWQGSMPKAIVIGKAARGVTIKNSAFTAIECVTFHIFWNGFHRFFKKWQKIAIFYICIYNSYDYLDWEINPNEMYLNYWNISKIIEMYPKLFKCIQNYWNVSKIVEMYPKLMKCIQNCWNVSKIVEMYPKL